MPSQVNHRGSGGGDAAAVTVSRGNLVLPKTKTHSKGKKSQKIQKKCPWSKEGITSRDLQRCVAQMSRAGCGRGSQVSDGRRCGEWKEKKELLLRFPIGSRRLLRVFFSDHVLLGR